MRRFLAPAILVAVLAGCSGWNDTYGKGDAPVGPRDDSAADVVNFPDQYQNVAVKCYGPNGIYTTTREAAPVVVKDDANCQNNKTGEPSSAD